MDNVTPAPGPANRVLDAILLHTEQEAAYRIENPAHRKNDPSNLVDALRHYQQVLGRYRKEKKLLPIEKATLRYVRHEIRRLNARTRPTLAKRLLYSTPVNVAFNFLLRRHKNYKNHNRQLETVENGTVIQFNLQSLQKQLSAKGFDFDLSQPLTRHLSHQLDAFRIRHNEPKYPGMDFVLNFKKMSDTDAYYFAGFDATKRSSLQEMLDNDSKAFKYSYSNSDKLAFTAHEATSIGHNRPIMKKIQGKDIWFIPDASQPNGFRLGNLQVEKELEAWPIREMKSFAARDSLIYSLQTGQVHAITVTLPDKTQEQWKVAVRSDGEGLTFTDTSGKHIDPFTKLQRNEHLEKLRAKALEKTNRQASEKKPGAKMRT